MSLLTAAAADTGRPLAGLLSEHPGLPARFAPDRLAEFLDPADYMGAADALVDRALRGYGGLGITPDHQDPDVTPDEKGPR